MLINFTVKNWKSFRDETTLSMLKTKEQQHKDRIPRSKDYKINILPVSAIYGANASGKSNLFEALEFAQKFIVQPSSTEKAIEIYTFKLDPTTTNEPSVFIFDLLLKNNIRYEYSFTVSKKEVLEEKLLEITKSGNEIILFHRVAGSDNSSFHKSISGNDNLKYAFGNTRDDILFLSKTNMDKIPDKPEVFQYLFDWFRHDLQTISPSDSFNFRKMDIENGNELLRDISKIVGNIDVGISKINIKKIKLPEEVVDSISRVSKNMKDVSEQDLEKAINEIMEELGKEIVFHHEGVSGFTAEFSKDEESDGTLRMIDLLPAFLNSSPVYKDNRAVIIIDEIDRSLHPLLTRNLIERFFDSCNSESRSQLIFTTHDVMLMDQDLLRRDETWVTQKNNEGVSELFSLAEFKDIRYDMDIMKNYMFGRFGGVPNIGDVSFKRTDSEEAEQ